MANRVPIVVPAIPPEPPVLSLLNSALRPDKTSDPSIGGSLEAITAEQLAALPDDLRLELEARKGEAWTRGIVYAPENHWEASLIDPCGGTSIDAPALFAPRGLALKAEAGKGTLAAETYEYQVTALNANGETVAKAAVKLVLGAEGAILLTWEKVNDAATYHVFRAKAETKKPLGLKSGAKALVVAAPVKETTLTVSYRDTGAATEEAGKEAPVSNTTGGTGVYTNLPNVEAYPYGIVAEDYCTTFGFDARDFKGRAERLLGNAQHKAIEKEFWTGAWAFANGYPNNYLAKHGTATNVTPEAGAPSAQRGLEILQESLQQCGFGGRGMIHTQAQTTPNFLKTRRVGAILLDGFDNIIVPGVGYPGTGPESEAGEPAKPGAGKSFMFASDLVSCRVEDEATVFAETFAEATDWGQGAEPNSIRMRARKFAVAYADMACCFAVEVTLPT
jgi:hypothetical protein